MLGGWEAGEGCEHTCPAAPPAETLPPPFTAHSMAAVNAASPWPGPNQGPWDVSHFPALASPSPPGAENPHLQLTTPPPFIVLGLGASGLVWRLPLTQGLPLPQGLSGGIWVATGAHLAILPGTLRYFTCSYRS